MKLAILATLIGSTAAFTASSFNGVGVQTSIRSSSSSTLKMETIEDLEVLALKLNPIVPAFDPLGLSRSNFWGSTQEETIGFIREAEIKHGRIAMFAFVGYLATANGWHFDWAMSLDGTPFPTTTNPPEAWDAIPDGGKLQIFGFVGFLEFWREVNSEKHYMRGGKPGEFPDFDSTKIPGGALNLYDPLGTARKQTTEEKANGLIKELNNGRAAMLGIIAFVSEAKIPGSVPLLKGLIQPYDGEIMAPLTKSILPHLPQFS